MAKAGGGLTIKPTVNAWIKQRVAVDFPFDGLWTAISPERRNTVNSSLWRDFSPPLQPRWRCAPVRPPVRIGTDTSRTRHQRPYMPLLMIQGTVSNRECIWGNADVCGVPATAPLPPPFPEWRNIEAVRIREPSMPLSVRTTVIF